MSHKFKGVGVALVTPFTSDEKIDFKALTKLVELQLEGGTDFLVVQGTTGESPVLSQKEKMEGTSENHRRSGRRSRPGRPPSGHGRWIIGIYSMPSLARRAAREERGEGGGEGGGRQGGGRE